MTNPVLYQDHLYALSDGYLECVKVEGLKRKWKRRKRFGNGQLILVGDKLLIQSEFGKLHLVKANPDKFEELSSFESIDGLCWNTLCLHRDLLMVRSDLEAACYRLPLSQ
jgi:outer membrane protein assembly factor BamB